MYICPVLKNENSLKLLSHADKKKVVSDFALNSNYFD